MRFAVSAVVLVGLGCGVCLADPPSFKTLCMTDKFYCEGAYYADFNKDGNLDVVAGPFWYEGPDFKNKHEIHPAKSFDPKGYSDNFLAFTGDFNDDGWPDVLYVPWPGKDASWYENPAGKQRPWVEHAALKDVGNESPMWGDVNGDGRVDILESGCWWEQPAEPDESKPWPKHAYKFADAAAQMLVYDVDGDGLADVITAWHCHMYGLVWHEQIRNADGRIDWRRHDILTPQPDVKSDALRISQLHALDLVDINGDGLNDVLTGKRFWAHGPKGDAEPAAPAVVYWFELRREKDRPVRFIPHEIHDNSGVGTQVTAADLNGDAVPDVIVGNKKGTFIHLSRKK